MVRNSGTHPEAPSDGRRQEQTPAERSALRSHSFHGEKPFALSRGPDTAQAMHDETLPQEVFKSAKFWSIHITQDIRKLAGEGVSPAVS